MKFSLKFRSCNKFTGLHSPEVAVWVIQPQCKKKSYRPTTIDNNSRMPSSKRVQHHKDSGLKTIRPLKKLTEDSSTALRENKVMAQLTMTRTIKTNRWTGTSIQLITTNWSNMQVPLTAPWQTRITSLATRHSWVPRIREDSSHLERWWELKQSRRCP